MPDLDSLSFALLIPFTVCFVILFLVCCFADKLKRIICLPSQLPTHYIGTNDYRRRRSNRDARHFLSQNGLLEENRILISNEEGRNRNISESSAESNDATPMYADVYSRIGVLPAYILITTPLNNPSRLNSVRTMGPVGPMRPGTSSSNSNSVQTDLHLPRPGFVVIQS